MPQEEEDAAAELLESVANELLRPEVAASPAAEAVQLRVPRRSRLKSYEREADAWFDDLAREAGESADVQTGEQS